jgi:predicted amidohydrolase YtcJ
VVRSVLLRNGSVYTPADPDATAMLVRGDRIAWVGREAGAARYAATADEVVDLDEALVTPAFVDAHVHTMGTAVTEQGVDLVEARSLADLLDRVAAYVAAHPGEVVGGQGWDEHGWPEGRAPTRHDLDRVANGAMVYLSRVDGHSAVVSTALVESVPGAARADGFEDGLVRREAQRLIQRAAQDSIPDEQRRELHRSVLRRAAALGIGAIHELAAPHITSEQDVRVLAALARDEPLPDVVPYWGEAGDGVARALALGARGAAGDLTLDGALGSHSAGLSAPYADDPATRGQLYLDVAAATDHVVACTEAGLQAGFHCIGDAAVRIAVTAMGQAAERCGESAVAAARHRLEHVEMISAEQIDELARLGVVASVQPAFDALWGGRDGMYAARLGPARAKELNPFAAMARAGVRLAFGSDSPVTRLGGWDAVRAAVHHHNPDHRMDIHEAFAAATRGGWYAAGVDDAGVLEPGMLASYAVWDGTAASGLHLSPGAPLPTCRRTVVRGTVAFDRDGGWAPAS